MIFFAYGIKIWAFLLTVKPPETLVNKASIPKDIFKFSRRLDTAGCVMFNFSAAAVIPFSSITVRNVLNSIRFMS